MSSAAHNFEYLPLLLRKQGPARFPKVVLLPDPQVDANKQNRAGHSGNLSARASAVVTRWKAQQERREEEGLPPTKGVPLLLKIDENLDVDLLRQTFQFEIVSEEPEGFVIVASEDMSLTHFQQKLTEFVATIDGSGNVARILDLREDATQEERLKFILSETLFNEWPSVQDDAPYICDV